MRLAPLLLLLLLSLATDVIYRPLWGQRLGTPDVTVLFILWLASVDRRQRVYSVVVVVGTLRSFLSLDTFPLPWLPLLTMVECQFLFRQWVHLRRPIRRLPVIAVTVGIGTAVTGFVLTQRLGADLMLATASGALWGTVVAAMLFPILDFFAPLLRNHRYPM